MRRIIKRTVTIVTTITWTISWHKAPRLVNVEVQPTTADMPELLVLPEGEPDSWEIETTLTKEVEVSETKVMSNPMADQPPDHLYHKIFKTDFKENKNEYPNF